MMSSPGDPAAAPVAGAGNTGSSENGSFSPHNLFSVIRRCQEIRIIFLSQGSDFSRNKNIEGLAITQIFLLLGRDCIVPADATSTLPPPNADELGQAAEFFLDPPRS